MLLSGVCIGTCALPLEMGVAAPTPTRMRDRMAPP